MESLNKLDEVYCREAKWTLENAFPMIRIHAIHAVFTYSKENFTDAFAYLAEIEDCRSTIKGLGRGEFGQMIPRHIDTFIKLKRKEKRLENTSERLCGERDTVALDPTQCDHKLLPAIEAVKTLVADTKRDYRDVPQVNNVDHVLCATNTVSILFLQCCTHKKSMLRVAKSEWPLLPRWWKPIPRRTQLPSGPSRGGVAISGFGGFSFVSACFQPCGAIWFV